MYVQLYECLQIILIRTIIWEIIRLIILGKMVSSIFFNFFLETKILIQWSLRQFLFEVNRTSILEEVLKKLCDSHHASTHISEKSCFRLGQKIHWKFRKCAGADFPVCGRQVKQWIFYQTPVKNSFTENNTLSVNYTNFYTAV